MSAPVTREHRKLVAAALGHAPGDADAEGWVDTGQLPESRYSWPYDEAPPDVNALAQSIADAEARGAARELARVLAVMRDAELYAGRPPPSFMEKVAFLRMVAREIEAHEKEKR